MKPKTNAEGWALVRSKIKRADLAIALELSRQFLYKWDEVPVKYLVDVERISGIPRDQILPELATLFKPVRRKNEEAQSR